MRLCILLLPRCSRQRPTSKQQSSPAGRMRSPLRASCARSPVSCRTTPRRRLSCRVSVPPSGWFTSRQAEPSPPAGLGFAMITQFVMRHRWCGGGVLLIPKTNAWSSHHNPADLRLLLMQSQAKAKTFNLLLPPPDCLHSYPLLPETQHCLALQTPSSRQQALSLTARWWTSTWRWAAAI
jgi:hypothetical protein